MTLIVNGSTTAESSEDGDAFLDELVQMVRDEQRDLAIALVELNALRAEGSISDAEFADRKAALYPAAAG